MNSARSIHYFPICFTFSLSDIIELECFHSNTVPIIDLSRNFSTVIHCSIERCFREGRIKANASSFNTDEFHQAFLTRVPAQTRQESATIPTVRHSKSRDTLPCGQSSAKNVKFARGAGWLRIVKDKARKFFVHVTVDRYTDWPKVANELTVRITIKVQ